MGGGRQQSLCHRCIFGPEGAEVLDVPRGEEPDDQQQDDVDPQNGIRVHSALRNVAAKRENETRFCREIRFAPGRKQTTLAG
jgi:hypothetical protein